MPLKMFTAIGANKTSGLGACHQNMAFKPKQ